MTKDTDLKELLMISSTRYDHQRQVFAKIVEQEKHLRQEIARLDTLGQSMHEDEETLSGMRVIGADLLWQGWLSRSKSELNMQLARILAIKAHEQEKVRQAFGKVVALQELIKAEGKKRQRKNAQTSLGLAIDHALR